MAAKQNTPKTSRTYLPQWQESDESSSSSEKTAFRQTISLSLRSDDSSSLPEIMQSPPPRTTELNLRTFGRIYGPRRRHTHSLVFRNYLEGRLGLRQLERQKPGAKEVLVSKEFESDEDKEEYEDKRECESAEPVEVGTNVFFNENRFHQLKEVEKTKESLASPFEQAMNILSRHSNFNVENLRKPRPLKKIYEFYDMDWELEKSTLTREQSDDDSSVSSKESSSSSEESEEELLQERYKPTKTSEEAHPKDLPQERAKPTKTRVSKPLENLFGNVETTAIDVMDNTAKHYSDTSVETVQPPKKRRRVFRELKPFKCTVCFKEFKLNWMLRCHQRVHTGEKPFKCEVCKVQFADSSNLTAHMRQLNHHSWMYKCDLCKKPFSKLTYLRRHNADACEKYFKKYSNMERKSN